MLVGQVDGQLEVLLLVLEGDGRSEGAFGHFPAFFAKQLAVQTPQFHYLHHVLMAQTHLLGRSEAESEGRKEGREGGEEEDEDRSVLKREMRRKRKEKARKK